MILKGENLSGLLQALANTQLIYVPAVEGNISKFVPFCEGVTPRFDLVNVKMPPKDALFPATEKMYRWAERTEAGAGAGVDVGATAGAGAGADADASTEVSAGEGAHAGARAGVREEGLVIESDFQEAAPFTLFGVRPCDMASIDRLDAVFLTCGYVDEFYETRRSGATIVALACAHPSQTCFCESMGVSPSEAPTADILLTECADGFIVEAQTDKGSAALEAWAPYVEESSARESQDTASAKEAHCSLAVDMSAVSNKLHAMFDDPLWQSIADQCITCGTCTFICPTCYCFDISQEVRGRAGTRFRCWDSCMFSDYTRMAGGHNPRADKTSRVRQRFMHKLCYFNDRYGMDLCVGCGRCMRDCPAAVDISLIIDRIAETPTKEVSAHA